MYGAAAVGTESELTSVKRSTAGDVFAHRTSDTDTFLCKDDMATTALDEPTNQRVLRDQDMRSETQQ